MLRNFGETQTAKDSNSHEEAEKEEQEDEGERTSVKMDKQNKEVSGGEEVEKRNVKLTRKTTEENKKGKRIFF